MQTHSQLAQLLLEEQVINSTQFEQITRAALRSGSTVVSTLIDQGILNEDILIATLKRRLRLEVFDPDIDEIEHDAIREIPHDQANRFRLLPVRIERDIDHRILFLAMADPLDHYAIDEIEFSSGCKVNPLIARPSELGELIRSHYRHIVTKIINRQSSNQENRKKQPPGLLAVSTEPLRQIQREASLQQRFDALLALMIHKGLITQKEYEDQLNAFVSRDSSFQIHVAPKKLDPEDIDTEI